MVLEWIWAAAFFTLSVYAGGQVKCADEDYQYGQIAGLWELVLFGCYVMTLFLLNDFVGAPLWFWLLDVLPQAGTPIQRVTAGVICFGLGLLGLLGVGWLAFQIHDWRQAPKRQLRLEEAP